MNILFEAALQHIDLEDYDKAKELISQAIEQELEKGNEQTATEYRCVLGELCGNLDEKELAREQFKKVLEFCDRTGTLPRQRAIAQTSLDFFDGKITAVQRANARRAAERPLVEKPVQNKAFISRQLNKRK